MSVFTILQAFIRVLRRVRNFVVISGTKESLRDDGCSVLTAKMQVHFLLKTGHDHTNDWHFPFVTL